MLHFITTITNGNDKLYNKTIVDYLGIGYDVDIHHWISTIALVIIGKLFKIVDQRIKFYSQNTNLLPPKPKSTFRHLKQGIQDFHRKYVLVPADKAANNVVVV